MRTAGFVLVGGRSSRMGRDKALLTWHGQTLVECIADKVREAAGNVALVGRPYLPDICGMICFPDLRPGLGPLSGIEAALESGRGDLNLIVSCDLPFLQTIWLKRLLEQAAVRGAKCLVYRDSDGRVHPLCAVYRSDCLTFVQQAIQAGRLRLMTLIEELGADCLALNARLWNVNTPEEWEQCQAVPRGR